MELKDFKKAYKKFSQLPLPKEVWNAPEHEKYLEAIHNKKNCGDWYKKQQVKKARINYKKHCCLNMAYHLIEDVNSEKQPEILNYDSVITYKKKSGDYGLPIHDGGSSYIKIKHCPWCGEKLKK